MHKLFITLLLVTANDWKQCKRPTVGAGRINCSTYAVGSQEVAEENERSSTYCYGGNTGDIVRRSKKGGEGVFIMLPLSKNMGLGE